MRWTCGTAADVPIARTRSIELVRRGSPDMIARFWSGATRRGALLVGGGPAEALYWSGGTRRGPLLVGGDPQRRALRSVVGSECGAVSAGLVSAGLESAGLEVALGRLASRGAVGALMDG